MILSCRSSPCCLNLLLLNSQNTNFFLSDENLRNPSFRNALLLSKPLSNRVLWDRDHSRWIGRKSRIIIGGIRYNPKKIDEGGCLVKFPTPAWSSPNLLNIAKFVESGLVFAHVRAAFDGTALTGNVNHENTHPFKVPPYVGIFSIIIMIWVYVPRCCIVKTRQLIPFSFCRKKPSLVVAVLRSFSSRRPSVWCSCLVSVPRNYFHSFG